MPFSIIRHDITKVHADAIVNTANPHATIGDGVDLAIYEAAGKLKLLAARRKIGYLNIGEVGITPAFDLNAKYIIHSSGPWWRGGDHQEAQLLRQCYDKALHLAYRHRCKSIAFPLMATGTYGFPKELGLQIALEAFNAFLLKHEMEIILVVFGESSLRVSGKIFDDVREFVDNSYVEKKLQTEYIHDNMSLSIEEEIADYCVEERPKRRRVESTINENTAELPRISAPKPSKARLTSHSLDYYMKKDEGSFGAYLQQMINKKGMKNSEVYAAANLTKQYFSKLLNGKVTPSKTKILSLAVALHLNMDETIDFLRMSGYAFSPFSQVDKVFEYFIRNKDYDIFKIDIVLFDYGLPTLVND